MTPLPGRRLPGPGRGVRRRPMPVSATEGDPAAAPPASIAADPAAKVDEFIRGVFDPLALRVARIHEEIQQLLRLHREVYDGIELATEQVQDKRIDFLEAGPQVTVADIFIEFALVFLLESQLAGAILRRVFRFAGDAATAALIMKRPERLRKFQEIQKKIQVARGSQRNTLDAGAEISAELRKQRAIENSLSATPADKDNARREVERLTQAQEANNRRRREQERIQERAEAALKRPPKLASQRLSEFFAETDNLVDSGVATAKAGVSAGKVADTNKPLPGALDSIGVQIKRLAQNELRDMEAYLEMAAADADMLSHIALRNPFLSQACYDLASEILAGLASSDETKDTEQITDIKQTIALEFEKLIWALLVADRFYPELKRKEATHVAAGPGEKAAAASEALAPEVQALFTKAPPLMEDYFRNRFFLGSRSTGARSSSACAQHKLEFLESTKSGFNPLKVIQLVPKRPRSRKATASLRKAFRSSCREEELTSILPCRRGNIEATPIDVRAQRSGRPRCGSSAPA